MQGVPHLTVVSVTISSMNDFGFPLPFAMRKIPQLSPKHAATRVRVSPLAGLSRVHTMSCDGSIVCRLCELKDCYPFSSDAKLIRALTTFCNVLQSTLLDPLCLHDSNAWH